jgi:hypothetical protein
VEVHDKDTFGTHDFLGEVVLHGADLSKALALTVTAATAGVSEEGDADDEDDPGVEFPLGKKPNCNAKEKAQKLVQGSLWLALRLIQSQPAAVATAKAGKIAKTAKAAASHVSKKDLEAQEEDEVDDALLAMV